MAATDLAALRCLAQHDSGYLPYLLDHFDACVTSLGLEHHLEAFENNCEFYLICLSTAEALEVAEECSQEDLSLILSNLLHLFSLANPDLFLRLGLNRYRHQELLESLYYRNSEDDLQLPLSSTLPLSVHRPAISFSFVVPGVGGEGKYDLGAMFRDMHDDMAVRYVMSRHMPRGGMGRLMGGPGLILLESYDTAKPISSHVNDATLSQGVAQRVEEAEELQEEEEVVEEEEEEAEAEVEARGDHKQKMYVEEPAGRSGQAPGNNVLEMAEAAMRHAQSVIQQEEERVQSQQAPPSPEDAARRNAAEESARRQREEEEREAKAKAEREAKAEADRLAKAKAEREAKARAEREAKAKASAEKEAKAKAKAEAKAKAKAEREAKAKAEREAKAMEAEAEAMANSEPVKELTPEEQAEEERKLQVRRERRRRKAQARAEEKARLKALASREPLPAAKCKAPGCQSFGNEPSEGYCNACFAKTKMTEEERKAKAAEEAATKAAREAEAKALQTAQAGDKGKGMGKGKGKGEGKGKAKGKTGAAAAKAKPAYCAGACGFYGKQLLQGYCSDCFTRAKKQHKMEYERQQRAEAVRQADEAMARRAQADAHLAKQREERRLREEQERKAAAEAKVLRMVEKARQEQIDREAARKRREMEEINRIANLADEEEEDARMGEEYLRAQRERFEELQAIHLSLKSHEEEQRRLMERVKQQNSQGGGGRGRGRVRNDRGHQRQQPKDGICVYFKEGNCTKGRNCRFSHSSAPPVGKSRICNFYARGTCRYGETCPDLHLD